MRLIPIQQAYTRKFDRQARTEGLELHCGGLCAHRGAISPGCNWCLTTLEYSWGVHLGTDINLPSICNLDCPYCYSSGVRGVSPQQADQILYRRFLEIALKA